MALVNGYRATTICEKSIAQNRVRRTIVVLIDVWDLPAIGALEGGVAFRIRGGTSENPPLRSVEAESDRSACILRSSCLIISVASSHEYMAF
jgi:hypothetical protein